MCARPACVPARMPVSVLKCFETDLERVGQVEVLFELRDAPVSHLRQ